MGCTPASCASPEIALTGFSTPVSLFAATTETKATLPTFSCASSQSRSTVPAEVSGAMDSAIDPESAKASTVRITESCSPALTSTRRRWRYGNPRNSRLFASVAPDVNDFFRTRSN